MHDAEAGPAPTPQVSARPGGVGALTSWTAADGTPRLASSGSDGTIQIWDPERGVRLGTPLDGHRTGVSTLTSWTWSGGNLLISTDEGGLVRIWDPDAGVLVRELSEHVGWVRAVTLWTARDGTPRLASAGADGVVRIWDPVTGAVLGDPLLSRHTGLAALASWQDGSGTRLAVAGDEGTIGIWDPETRQRVGDRQLDHTAGVWALAAWQGPDGPRLGSAGIDGTIRIWNPEAATPVGEPLRGHTGWVPTLATWTTPDGTGRLVSASSDGTIRVWNADTGAPIGGPLRADAGSLPALTIWTGSDGSKRFAYVGESGAIHSCDAESGSPLDASFIGHTAGLWALTSWPGPDGRRLAASGDDGVIRIWNADTGRTVGQPLLGHTAAVWALVAWTGLDGAWLASTGDDGTIRRWRPDTGEPVGEPLTGHAGWVPALTTWIRPDGGTGLGSGGIDGTIRRWDPVTGQPVGDPLQGHDGWVMALAAWHGPDGARLASGGVDGKIRLWNPDTGAAIGVPLRGHTGWVRTLATWSAADGRTLLVSGGYDGSIRVWDPEAGSAVGGPLNGHSGRVAALTTWTALGGAARLASTGDEGALRIWDLDAGRALGDPLRGHDAGVWTMTGWTDPGLGVRLASAGRDGTVRLWDPERGRAVRTIEVGPVALWGMSDIPTTRDVIGRQHLAEAIADQICRPRGNLGVEDLGPTVVSIEGPWGCGKTTLMDLVRQRLPVPRPPADRSSARKQLTVREVLRQVSRYAENSSPRRSPVDPPKAVVTAWFNPWAHQSGEQVWAGLVNEIVDAAQVVLYPTEPDRERYWVARNLGRVDRYALRRALRRRTRSPILGLAIAAIVAPVVIAIARLSQPIELLDIPATPIAVALGVAAAAILAGVLHTAGRRRWGKAVQYLSSDFLNGPLVDGGGLGDTDASGLSEVAADPLRRARAGALYLLQHNIGGIIDDLATAGYELVVFVDDIDRCRPGTTAEVFEAINLFVSNVASRTGLWAHFVIGLDSAVVAARLDALYDIHHDPRVALHGDDPTPGWAFLRKLIQLPVTVPQVADDGVERFVDAITQRTAPASSTGTVRRLEVNPGRTGTGPEHPSTAPAPIRSQPKPATAPLVQIPVDTYTWRSMEQHPEVRGLVVQRLCAQPFRSIREAKRLLNVWQLYARILDVIEPLAEPAAAIARARLILLVAEIVTRWPALQRTLHRRYGNQRGLQLLADAVDDDDSWEHAVRRLGLDTEDQRQALTNLRSLLTEYDAEAITELAARLM